MPDIAIQSVDRMQFHGYFSEWVAEHASTAVASSVSMPLLKPMPNEQCYVSGVPDEFLTWLETMGFPFKRR